ncbi:hypothetical protein DL546_000788 [Coniochaeta pulveracea]|uniref:Uncharacterized protein n=1 Tax=Coniochaeta pulveracea TaxID=177199 RepID=A0A420XXQ7_9PEZI|nr:hypothetical protein DL546_000788 [Coniochaeta pulveracea]
MVISQEQDREAQAHQGNKAPDGDDNQVDSDEEEEEDGEEEDDEEDDMLDVKKRVNLDKLTDPGCEDGGAED